MYEFAIVFIILLVGGISDLKKREVNAWFSNISKVILAKARSSKISKGKTDFKSFIANKLNKVKKKYKLAKIERARVREERRRLNNQRIREEYASSSKKSKDFVSSIAVKGSNVIKNSFNSVKSSGKKIVNSVKKFARKVWNTVKQAGVKVVELVKSSVKWAGDKVNSVKKWFKK